MPRTHDLSKYDVRWDTASAGPAGSMPIGNGDLGANVWVEPNGDVLLLVGKTDAWDENSSLLKLGRVRIRFDPPLEVDAGDFVQHLYVTTASVDIRARVAAGIVELKIYVDANYPAIRVSIESPGVLRVCAILETWRNYPYAITTQTGDLFKNLTGKDPYRTVVLPDETAVGRAGEILAWHHNVAREHDAFEINLALQGLADVRGGLRNPLLGRTFGMALVGHNGWRNADGRTIETTGSRCDFFAYGLTQHPSEPANWRTAIERVIHEDHASAADHWAGHVAWWAAFWQRSHLLVSSATDASAFDVTRAYLLQRYMNASAGRGAFPIKHNGSIFTVGRPWDPDFRRWGGPGFWFMNQRLIYWPMLADGDFDLMTPWLNMYLQTLPLQAARTRKYFGHAGAHFPEAMTFWGADLSAHYGWTPFEHRDKPEAECAYLTYYWSGAIELILILAEHAAYTGDNEIVADMLVPIADAVTAFYDAHYPRDAAGRLRFEPAQALETWHWAIDPMPEVAGLRYTLARLLSVDGVDLPTRLIDRCRRLLNDVPPLPVGQRDGESLLLPAAKFDRKKNTENPELYCVFPYRLFGVGKPDLELARRTFARRLHVEHTCWHQDVIQMALLGLTDQAKDFVSRRASAECHSDSRFPAFWNAFHDWVPDIDHGGVLQLALQNMLVQCDGNTVRLLPAWPADWDADFKLHLPGPAVMTGRVSSGRLEALTIDPPDRMADVIVMPAKGESGRGHPQSQ